MSETRGRSLTRQVHQRLLERVREAGKGAERRIEEVLDRRPGWLRDRRRTGAIELGLLLDALDYLGEDPKRFFRLALGEEERPESARLLGDPPPIVKLVRARGSVPPHGVPCGPDELETLDRLRHYQPYRVVELAEAAIPRTPRALLPHLLGVAASAYRNMLDLANGEHTIAAAIDLSRENCDHCTTASLFQRLSYITADRGDHTKALRLAERATGIHIRNRDFTRIGSSLITQGMRLFFLDRLNEAIAVYEAALEYLPESATIYRAAALYNLAFNYQKLNKPGKAFIKAVRAHELLTDPREFSWLAGLVHSVLASSSVSLGQLTEAEEHLLKMIVIYRPLHIGETALATTALVRVKLLLAKSWEAYQTARSMLQLLESLRDDQDVSAAIADLLRGSAADLTISLVDRVIALLETARKRPDWCLLRTAEASS